MRAGGIMKIRLQDFWLQFTVLLAMCAVPISRLCAQAGTANAEKSAAQVEMASASQPADTPTSKPHDDGFIIGNDDVLAVNVWKEPDISRSIPVRSDGKISLPLVGEVQATGRTPLKLEEDIAARLRNYISEPEVT